MTTESKDGLNHILLATDFSTRSDRAAGRALLLAKQFEARVTIVHVVDDDQPRRLMKAARQEAENLIESTRDTWRDVHHVKCESTIAVGEAFAGTLAVAEDSDTDLIVIGPHRRQLLRDVFTGTTAERIVRESRRPVLMANTTPSSQYRSILVAVDLSAPSAAALRLCESFQLSRTAAITIAHVFDTPASGHMRRASLTQYEIDDYVAAEQTHAAAALRDFLRQQAFDADRTILQPDKGSVAGALEDAANECSADLTVIGTHGREGAAKLLLGSVTEALMGHSTRDVLAVPPPDRTQAARR